jgi:membrane protein implicated in regulation of membrane protease activity
MPIWFTIAIGIAASILAGLLSQVLFNEPSSGFVLALLAAIGIVIAYRRFVQGRGITGPDAKRVPTRGVGVQRELEEKLRDLRDAELLTETEYDLKLAELRRRT